VVLFDRDGLLVCLCLILSLL